MVSLAETHLKLLFSADTEERELQGFTLVQLLLVSTAIEPCFNLWTPHCNRQFSLSLGKKSPHILSKFNPLDMYTLLIQTLSMAPSVSLLTGFDSTKNNLSWYLWKKREESFKPILQTWVYESCHYLLCLEILRFDSFVWTMSKCPVKFFTWLKIWLVSCECNLTLLKNSLTWYQPLLETLLLLPDLLRALQFYRLIFRKSENLRCSRWPRPFVRAGLPS